MRVFAISLVWAVGCGVAAPAADPGGPSSQPAASETRRLVGGEALEEWFTRTDRDGDGYLSKEEFSARPRLARRTGLFARLDSDGDGRLTRSEWAGLGRLGLSAAQPDSASTTTRPAAAETQPGPAANAPATVWTWRDLGYAEVAGVDPQLLSLDVYAPADGTKHPVLVLIHGGGWRGGDKANSGLIDTKIPFFCGHGYVLVSINYRLSPAVRHPVHVQDVARALAWVGGHIAEYGGDPQQIVLMGHSAGAHLAALVAADDRYLRAAQAPPDLVDGVILLDGAGYEIAELMPEVGSVLGGLYRTAFGDDPAGWRDASPVVHIAAGRSYPPYLILHVANRDESRTQARRLAEALERAGGRARVYAAEGKSHMTINRDIGRSDDAPTRVIMEFLADLRGTRPDRPALDSPP